jgi:hypothetical protein
MVRRIAAFLAVSLIGLFLSIALWGQCKPDEVVMTFCRLDATGVRLGWLDCGATDSLVLWSGEPGWDQAMVIDGYDLLQSHRSGDTMIVSVRYRQVGWWSGGELLPAPGKPIGDAAHAEIVNFKLVETRNCWKILTPLVMPHISLDNTISYFGRWVRRTEQEVDPDTLNASIAKYIRDMRNSYDALVRYRESKKQ